MSDEHLAEPETEALAFEVSEEEAGTRLDALLAARVEGVSRTALKRLIDDGDATVAGRAAKPSHKVRAGDRVEVELVAPPPLDLAPEDIPLDIVHEHLAEQFRARTVFKSYVALVHGRLKEDAGRVEQPLARDPRHRTRMAVVRGGREAVTAWRVRRTYERFTLLDVKIKTGRTHQIRVHLAWLKHPVVGDETYGMGRDRNLADARLRAALSAL